MMAANYDNLYHVWILSPLNENRGNIMSANIIPFPKERVSSSQGKLRRAKARIIIFPGIRIERLPPRPVTLPRLKRRDEKLA
jgi:hypothetical protein